MWELSQKIAEISKCKLVCNCDVQESRFRGKSIRMICRKASQYKVYFVDVENSIRGVCFLLAEKWVYQVTDISRFKDGMTVIIVIN